MNKKKLIGMVIGVILFTLLIAGATYAWFAASATNNTTIVAQTGSASLNLTIRKMSNDADGALVPQLGTALQSAITGTSNKSCLDGNGNTVCQIYEIEIVNNSTIAINITGNIAISTNHIANLRWTEISSATTAGSYTPRQVSYTTLESGSVLAANGGTKKYYVAIWLEEQNNDQTAADASGSFRATVSFNSDGDGITSTFTGDGSSHTPFTGTIYRYSNETIKNGQSISVLSDYETDVSKINNNYYLKHTVVNDIVTESYVEFVVTSEMKAIDSNMKVGTYALKGGDNGASFSTNTSNIFTAFGGSNCNEELSNADCTASDVYLYAYTDDEGSVNVDNDVWTCDVHSDGISCCSEYGVSQCDEY